MKWPERIQRRKSFFVRFLCSFIVVLMIPLITILFIYFTAEKMIKDEILSAADTSLSQFFNGLDSNLSEMIEVCTQAMYSTPVKSFAYTVKYTNEPDIYNQYEIKKLLSQFPRSKYIDLFVYYNHFDKIVSAGNASLKRGLYYQAYYKDAADAQEFDAVLRPEIYNKPVLFAFPSESGTMLGLSWKQNVSLVSDEESDITVAAILYPRVLNGILNSAVYKQNGNILIFDGHKNLLASAGVSDAEFTLDQYEESGKMYDDRFGDEEYMMLVRHSDVVDCYYASAVSRDYFWKRLNDLRIACGTGLIFCIFLSAAIAVLLSKRFYAPITSVLHTIKSRADQNYAQSCDQGYESEFEFIGNVLKESFESNQKLRQKLHWKENSARDEFLIQTMCGILKAVHYQDNIFTDYGILLKSDAFMAAQFKVETVEPLVVEDPETQEGKKMLLLILQNVLEELCAGNHQGFLLNPEPGLYCLLINFSPRSREEALEEGISICESGKKFLQESLGITCTVSLGTVRTGLDGIRATYKEAAFAMRYRFSFGKGSLILYHDVEQKQFRYNPISDSVSAQMIMQYIKNVGGRTVSGGNTGGDRTACNRTGSGRTEATGVIREILESQHISEEDALETLECFKFDMINTLSKIYLETGTPPSEREEGMSKLLKAETFEEFRQSLAVSMIKIREHEMGRSQRSDVCARAETYIRENYRDTELNVNKLGAELDLSPAYLSRLFREKNGMGPLDYLYQIRIEKAREELKETGKSVSEIALETGFLSSSALIKVFKKQEGITPGAYRELAGKG